MKDAVVTMAVATIIAGIGTGLVLRYARRRLLDVVTERSSHAVPTPRGGGLGLVTGILAAWVLTVSWSQHWTWATGAIVIGIIALASVGWWDDHVGLRARTRLPVQIAVAVITVWAMGLPEVWTIGPWHCALPLWAALPIAWIGMVWLINLTNFMDGIDGLAGSQGLIAGVSVFILIGAESTWGLLGLATAGASLGFLAWNFPPAKIFMGDVGSTALGFIFAVLILALLNQGVALEVALLPIAPFMLDSTCTLIRRVWRREKVSQAHRSHLYQRLARYWGGHRSVTLLYSALAVMGGAGAYMVVHGWVPSWLPVLGEVFVFVLLTMYARQVAPVTRAT